MKAISKRHIHDDIFSHGPRSILQIHGVKTFFGGLNVLKKSRVISCMVLSSFWKLLEG